MAIMIASCGIFRLYFLLYIRSALYRIWNIGIIDKAVLSSFCHKSYHHYHKWSCVASSNVSWGDPVCITIYSCIDHAGNYYKLNVIPLAANLQIWISITWTCQFISLRCLSTLIQADKISLCMVTF